MSEAAVRAAAVRVSSGGRRRSLTRNNHVYKVSKKFHEPKFSSNGLPRLKCVVRTTGKPHHVALRSRLFGKDQEYFLKGSPDRSLSFKCKIFWRALVPDFL